MDKQDMISIVVPAYENASCMERCVMSIINQTYQNWELLLVCTTSHDSTVQIGKRLESMDSRIRYLDSKGVGVSIARNTALKCVRGCYTAFIDADDTVDPYYLELLYQGIQGYDISICGLDRIRNEESTFLLQGNDINYFRNELIVDVLCNNSIGGYLCNKLFRTDVIVDHQISLDEELSIGEDMLFIIQYLKYVQKGKYINRVLYHYWVNENSALQRMYSTGEFEPKKLTNMLAAHKIANELSVENRNVQDAVAYRMVRTSLWTFYNTLKCHYYSREILEKIQDSCKGHLKVYCRNSQSKWLEKFIVCFIRVWPSMTWRVADILLRRFPVRLQRKYVN